MTGQRHGKQFEEWVKALLYSGSSDTARKINTLSPHNLEEYVRKLLGFRKK